jgi:L-aspartate oxidase
LTEALRGDGAVLVDQRGYRFMVDEHRDAELAPRDVVARAIWRVLAGGGKVFLDGREAVGEAFPERFPTVFGLCADDGVDPRAEPMPAAPAAHYHMGGIVTDLAGRTSLSGLWAVGEAARTGVHGANRLASNSLLEGAVFGSRAAADILELSPSRAGVSGTRRAAIDPGPAPEAQPDVVAALRDLMWEQVGLVRTGSGLVSALEEMDRLGGKLAGGVGEAQNMLTAARLIAAAALIRTESRGGHYRTDHPVPSDRWRRSIEFNR